MGHDVRSGDLEWQIPFYILEKKNKMTSHKKKFSHASFGKFGEKVGLLVLITSQKKVCTLILQKHCHRYPFETHLCVESNIDCELQLIRKIFKNIEIGPLTKKTAPPLKQIFPSKSKNIKEGSSFALSSQT